MCAYLSSKNTKNPMNCKTKRLPHSGCDKCWRRKSGRAKINISPDLSDYESHWF